MSEHKIRYEEGQVWTYRSREEESNSRVAILKIEEDPDWGKIYHIALDGLAIVNPKCEGGLQTSLPHLPVSEQTLNTSLCTLEEEQKYEKQELPEAYFVWREAFEAGKASVFQITIEEIIHFIEHTLEEERKKK